METTREGALSAVQSLPGIKVELCGSWMWVTGDTRQHKETLKAAGYRFSGKKVAWYWHAPGYAKLTRRVWAMDEIRATFGSDEAGVVA